MNELYQLTSTESSKLSHQGQPKENVADLNALLRTVWRGKWIIALTTAFAIILGVYYAYFVAVPVYRASATVMLQTRPEQVVNLDSIVSNIGSDDAEINTQLQVMSSRNLLGKVVDELNLVNDPEFNPALRSPSLMSRVRSKANDLLQSQSKIVSEAPEQKEESIRNNVINNLLRNLSLQNVPNSYVFRITAVSESPYKAVHIVDTLANNYIDEQLDVKFEAMERATSWLTNRVAELQTELENAEANVKSFSNSTDFVNAETLASLERQLKDLRARAAAARTAAQTANAALTKLMEARTPEERVAATNDTELKGYLPRIQEPLIRQAFDNRYNMLVQRARMDLERADNQAALLTQSTSELMAQTERQSQDLIELQQLQREATASRGLYEYFLTRLKETSAQQGIQEPDSRALSYGVAPQQPSEPKKSLILVLAGFCGVMFGVGFVMLRELRQNTFRSGRELETATGYATMGQIPQIPVQRRKDVPKYLAEKPQSSAAEAIRNLRTSVLLSDVGNPPQVIAISSSLPGEGKTTVSISLAQNFSGLGKKVLLIEGDIRRRTFAQYMQISDEHGLLSALAGEHTLSEVIYHNEHINADVLVSENTPVNAGDLFASDAFAKLIEIARESYDYIVIDTAPVLLVPDARLIAPLVDATLFVVGWDKTNKSVVVEALQMFESVNAPVKGLVLNRVNAKGMKRYGYGEYFDYGNKYYTN